MDVVSETALVALDAIHLINEDPTRLRESVKESRLGNLVQRLEQLDGTYYDELIPYLVHLDKYDTIICIDASKGIAQRDHLYAFQKTATILTPFVPYEDLVYAATSDGFIWWTRAHGMKFDMKNIVPQNIPYKDYGSVVRNWYIANHASVSDKELRDFERRTRRMLKRRVR